MKVTVEKKNVKITIEGDLDSVQRVLKSLGDEETEDIPEGVVAEESIRSLLEIILSPPSFTEYDINLDHPRNPAPYTNPTPYYAEANPEWLMVEREWMYKDGDYGVCEKDYGDYGYRYEVRHIPTDTLIGQDGGEPEDQTLMRDWRWVTLALQEAEERGAEKATGCIRCAVNQSVDRATSSEEC